MALSKQSSPAKAKQLPQPQTLEVPRVLSIRIANGIIETADSRGSVLQLLFSHLQGSMNDKHSLVALKGLAEAHGYSVEVEDK